MNSFHDFLFIHRFFSEGKGGCSCRLTGSSDWFPNLWEAQNVFIFISYHFKLGKVFRRPLTKVTLFMFGSYNRFSSEPNISFIASILEHWIMTLATTRWICCFDNVIECSFAKIENRENIMSEPISNFQPIKLQLFRWWSYFPL